MPGAVTDTILPNQFPFNPPSTIAAQRRIASVQPSTDQTIIDGSTGNTKDRLKDVLITGIGDTLKILEARLLPQPVEQRVPNYPNGQPTSPPTPTQRPAIDSGGKVGGDSAGQSNIPTIHIAGKAVPITTAAIVVIAVVGALLLRKFLI